MKISTRLVLFLSVFAMSAEAADPASEAYEAARTSYKSLKALPDAKLAYRHYWQPTIDKFEAVADKHPKSDLADDAIYMAGTLYFELYDRSRLSKDLQTASKTFDRCQAKFPKSNYADDCLFWQAKALHILDRHDDETKVLQKILAEYSSGDMAKDARAQLAKLDPATHKVEAVAERAPATPKATPAQAVAVSAPSRKSGGEAQEESQQVTDVKVWSNEGYTRVGIYLGGDAQWTVNDLKADGDKPPRVYIDFTRAHVGEKLKTNAARLGNDWEVPIGDGLLQRARVNQFDSDTVRVVLDVASMEKYEVVQLDDPFRVLVDVTGVGSAPVAVAQAETTPALSMEELARRLSELERASGATPIPTVTPMSAADIERRIRELEKKKGGYSLAQQLGLKAARIYVDAGHGGHDPGAIGPSGLREKDVTLAIAKKVREKLIALGYDAILTRKDDTFLELEERTGIANGGKGDLFVSIHCNSTDPKSKSNPSGVETYFANSATDAAAERLSAIENATTTETMSGLQAVLESLARNEFTGHSADLAGTVQESLYKTAKKHNPETRDFKVKSALFYVLLTARMPAILVETAFISNPKDEKRLKDPKYVDALAESIAQGIEDYLSGNGMKKSGPVKVAAEPDDKTKGR